MAYPQRIQLGLVRELVVLQVRTSADVVRGQEVLGDLRHLATPRERSSSSAIILRLRVTKLHPRGPVPLQQLVTQPRGHGGTRTALLAENEPAGEALPTHMTLTDGDQRTHACLSNAQFDEKKKPTEPGDPNTTIMCTAQCSKAAVHSNKGQSCP